MTARVDADGDLHRGHTLARLKVTTPLATLPAVTTQPVNLGACRRSCSLRRHRERTPPPAFQWQVSTNAGLVD